MRIDQFQSQFKSALKAKYSYSEPTIAKIALITDEDSENSRLLRNSAEKLVPLWAVPDWVVYSEDSYLSVKDLLEQINISKPNLIICQRNIKTSDDNLIYGLSDYTDALTQVTSSPVLLLPNNFAKSAKEPEQISRIVAQTDHITGDQKLISWAAAFARPKGHLLLTHIEDDKVFQYYIDAISKIPEIDTDLAAEKIKDELIKLPTDFINDAKSVLKSQFYEMKIEGIVKLGHTLEDYKSILERNQVDLLVLNTKVEGQLAMSGRAYALAVELKNIALLLL